MVCDPKMLMTLSKHAADVEDGSKIHPAHAMKTLSSCPVDPTNTTSHLCVRLQRGLKYRSKLLMEVQKERLMIPDKLPPTKLHLRPGPGVHLYPTDGFMNVHKDVLDRQQIDELSLNLAVALQQLYGEKNTSSALLQAYWVNKDGHLVFPDWIKDVVFFQLAKKNADPQTLITPYLRTRIDRQPRYTDVELHELDEIHHRDPGMLVLGRALLELNLLYRGLSIDDHDFDSLDDSDDNDEAMRANNEYFRCAQLFEAHESKLQNSHWLSKAIGACFELRQEDDIPLKEYIQSKIVRPLLIHKQSRSPSEKEVEKNLNILRAKTLSSEAQEMELTTSSLCLYGNDREERVDKTM